MANSSDLKLINTTRNFGNAACILAGFAFTKGDHVGYLDTDLQDPPELFEKLYQVALSEGIDIVHTKRTKRHGENPIKLLITKVGYAILGYSLSIPLQPNVGDFKLLTKRVVQAVLLLDEPLPFIRGMISYVGFKSKTIEYEREARFAGETHMPVYSQRVISNFINNALISYSDLPIHLIIWLSVLGLFFAAVIAAYVVYIKLNGLAVPGSAGVILAITIFSSLILMSIGILGLYMSSIKKAVLRRPAYLIESIRDSSGIIG
jgi:dolichol-phosphate mannosyltransferase